MARNPFSFDGVDAGLVFIDGSTNGEIRHRLQASYGARALGANWSRAGVVRGEADELAVTVTPARIATVAAGMAYVEHSDGIKYCFINAAAKTLSIPVSVGGTQVTAIYVQIDTTTVLSSIAQVRGAAGAGNPTVPANSLVLAYVTVPVTGNPTVAYPSPRYAATLNSAGNWVSTGSAPASPIEGDGWYDTGANELNIYDGSAWQPPVAASRIARAGSMTFNTSGTNFELSGFTLPVDGIIGVMVEIPSSGPSVPPYTPFQIFDVLYLRGLTARSASESVAVNQATYPQMPLSPSTGNLVLARTSSHELLVGGASVPTTPPTLTVRFYR